MNSIETTRRIRAAFQPAPIAHVVAMTDWRFYTESDGSIRLRGTISAHPTINVGKPGVAWTSPIVRIEGRYITTRSGTMYKLVGPMVE